MNKTVTAEIYDLRHQFIIAYNKPPSRIYLSPEKYDHLLREFKQWGDLPSETSECTFMGMKVIEVKDIQME